MQHGSGDNIISTFIGNIRRIIFSKSGTDINLRSTLKTRTGSFGGWQWPILRIIDIDVKGNNF